MLPRIGLNGGVRILKSSKQGFTRIVVRGRPGKHRARFDGDAAGHLPPS